MVHSNKGFTLLELLISITLIGIIVVILAGAMRLGSRSIASGEKKIEQLDRLRATINFLDSQIQSLLPITHEVEGEFKNYFVGEREFLQFATNYSVWGGEKGYVIATYTVKTNEEGKQDLYISESIIGIDFLRETKLIGNFDRIYFEYYYVEPLVEVEKEQGVWVDHWEDESSIPEKILCHFIKDNEDSPILIPVRVTEIKEGAGT